MDNLKEALENRIDALFSDTSTELYNEACRLASSVSRNYSDNPLENLKEKVIEGELIIKTIGEGLVDFCNKKLSEFEKEISGIQEPHKSEASNKYRDLLITESQRIIKELFNERVLE